MFHKKNCKMNAFEIYKIGQRYIPTESEFSSPIQQNVGINMQSLDKIPAQESFSYEFNKIVKKIPWKDLMIWTAIGGCIYLLWKIPPKKIIHEENDDFQIESIPDSPIL